MLDKLLPEHAIADHSSPLLTNCLGGTQRTGIQVSEYLLRYVIQAFSLESNDLYYGHVGRVESPGTYVVPGRAVIKSLCNIGFK